MNGLLDTFIDAESSADLCLGLGDYLCDSAFIGAAATTQHSKVPDCA